MSDDLCKSCGYEQPCRYLKFVIGFLTLLITVAAYSIGSLSSQTKELGEKYNSQNIEYATFKSQTQTYLQEQRIVFQEIKLDIRDIKQELNRLKNERQFNGAK